MSGLPPGSASGVTSAFPGGWLSHPEDQIEEENREK